ncbi:arsenate reductase ArsC [Bowmanella pacifica]|uniref:Protein-tyrosine-phosphatase n=1 Tax=Bowmanella pacifica TaxID=502051 RepID=A0A917YVF9_9ALTE|nr:arsenate reductase ArsC [Bowmanella pacifica]GGO67757.1 protein-tyrosine-phosphatase [Bowmanella pacifica]
MKILYICTHNRCRSILSEAITNHLADGLIEARSAGSQPAGQVHPLSLKYLAEAGIATDGLQSQSWDEFEDFVPDLVITVCDSAAGESCPLWFGKSLKLHWGLEDPSKLSGSDEQVSEAFRHCIALIKARVLALKDLAGQDKSTWATALQQLGASQ